MFAVQICSQLIWSHRRKFELAAPIAPSVVTLVVAGVTVAQQRVTFRTALRSPVPRFHWPAAGDCCDTGERSRV